MKIKPLFERLISDFFLFDRINDYDRILFKALNQGYQVLSHSEYFELVKSHELDGKKILIIRQDVDSDPKYVLQWLKIQRKYNVHSSIYFRKCTFNASVMKQVKKEGSDCGYHYEELADYAKMHKLTDRELVKQKFPEIRELFKENLRSFEERLGFKLLYIASHGDFANRILDLPNRDFITPELLNECGLLFEAYQPEFIETSNAKISDCGYPTFYKGDMNVEQAIDQNIPIIQFLMHPKHWRSSWYWNIYENIKRVREGMKFK